MSNNWLFFFDEMDGYDDLTDEEQLNLDYISLCLFNSDERMADKYTMVMLLILSQAIHPDEEVIVDPDEMIKTIYNDVNEEEKHNLELFTYACVKSLGILSNEAKMERKLKKGND